MRPMLASPGDLPVGPEWAYEVKWDGVRALCDVQDGRVRVTGRSGSDLTAAFPELGALGDLVPDVLLDGELVAFDAEGRPRFGALLGRLHTGRGRRAPGGSPRTMATLVAFDALRVAGRSLLSDPYEERRAVLAGLSLDGPAWQTPASFDDGPALLAATAERGLEGVVAKRRSSRYSPGLRSHDWVKVPHRRTRSFVVGGFRAGSSPGPGRMGSLVVGSPVGDGLLALDGAAGSGLTATMQRALRSVLDDLVVDAPPFDDAAASLPASAAGPVSWCEPIVVVDVASLGRTEQGLLRQPSVVRVRPDLRYEDLLRAEEQA